MNTSVLSQTTKRLFFHFLILLVCIGAVGCLSAGKKVDANRFDSIGENATISQVEARLGKPSASFTENGRTILRYYHIRANPYADGYGTVGVQQQTAEFLFDEDGVLLKKLASSGSVVNRQTGFNSHRTGAPLTREQILQIKNGFSYQRVREVLGAPFSEELNFDGGIIRGWIYAEKPNFARETTTVLLVSFDEGDWVTAVRSVQQ